MIKCPNCGHICANIYDSGMDAGYSRSRDELKEIIESMAYEIATHRNPRFYTHNEYGYQIKRFPANWNLYGKSAGPIRNKSMAEYAAQEQGVLFAFWNGKSKGTKSMINFAEKYGLDVHVVRY